MLLSPPMRQKQFTGIGHINRADKPDPPPAINHPLRHPRTARKRAQGRTPASSQNPGPEHPRGHRAPTPPLPHAAASVKVQNWAPQHSVCPRKMLLERQVTPPCSVASLPGASSVPKPPPGSGAVPTTHQDMGAKMPKLPSCSPGGFPGLMSALEEEGDENEKQMRKKWWFFLLFVNSWQPAYTPCA